MALLTWAAWSGFSQAVTEAQDHDPGSPTLAALQFVVGCCALTALVGAWRRAPWARHATLAWGVTCAVMVVLLAPLGFVDQADRGGLWKGALVILALMMVLWWYIGRWRQDVMAPATDATSSVR
jgi:peptidoglycan/LPS O-acetylase OafA/YrhL